MKNDNINACELEYLFEIRKVLPQVINARPGVTGK